MENHRSKLTACCALVTILAGGCIVAAVAFSAEENEPTETAVVDIEDRARGNQTDDSLSDDVSALRAEIAELRDSVESRELGNRRATSGRLGLERSAEASSRDEIEAIQQGIEDRRDRELVRMQQHTRTLSVMLSQEGADPDWAGWAERAIVEGLRAELPEGMAREPRCGSTMCRFELEFEDIQERELYRETILGFHPWSGERFFFGDETSLVVFIARQDESLPRPS